MELSTMQCSTLNAPQPQAVGLLGCESTDSGIDHADGDLERSVAQVDLSFVLECFDEQEAGDAKLFAHLLSDRAVYDYAERRWYMFQQNRWIEDDIGRIRKWVTEH